MRGRVRVSEFCSADPRFWGLRFGAHLTFALCRFPFEIPAGGGPDEEGRKVNP